MLKYFTPWELRTPHTIKDRDGGYVGALQSRDHTRYAVAAVNESAALGLSADALESGAVRALVEALLDARRVIWDYVPEDATGAAEGILTQIDDALAPFAEQDDVGDYSHDEPNRWSAPV